MNQYFTLVFFLIGPVVAVFWHNVLLNFFLVMILIFN